MIVKRDRVYASIRRTNVDAIPWQFDLTTAVSNKLKTYYSTDNLFKTIGDHMIPTGSTPPKGYVEESPADGFYRNEFGVVWRRSPRDLNVGDWGELVSYPLKEPSLNGYTFPDGSLPGRWSHVSEVRKRYPDHFLWMGGYGLFEPAWALCGFENYLSYIAGEPAFVEAVTEKLSDFSCQVITQLKGLGVDGIRFGDDWGFQDGLMIRLETWRKLFKEHYRRIFDTAHKLGLIVMVHSCGNITDLLGDFIEIGVQVVHPFQPEAMDVSHCKQEFGKDITFWGGLGSQSTLPLGTPEDVKREVRHRLNLFKNGGYILAPAGAAPAETPPENIAAIVEVAFEQLL
jgi:uroporphyrinogen decarboxylase